MRKQLMTIGLATLLAASSLYASGGYKKGCDDDRYEKRMHAPFSHYNGGVASVMGALSQMELSDDQWIEVKMLMLEMKKQRMKSYSQQKMSSYWNDSGSFDAKGFVKDGLERAESRLQAQAKMIEQLGSILSEEQMEELREDIDDPEKTFGKYKRYKRGGCDR